MPPIFLSTQSLASSTPRSVLRNKHSPGFVNPLTQLAVFPRTIFSRSLCPIHIRCLGLLSIFIDLNTGSEFQYLSPSHSRRDATLACVMTASAASGEPEYAWGCEVGVRMRGGLDPPRVTEERKPAVCSCSIRARWSLVEGTEVRPSRAFEAF